MLEQTCKELEALAIAENWDKIDTMVPEVCNKPGLVEHAYATWMYHENVNVRDLSGTVIEAADIREEKFADMRKNIAEAMQKEDRNYAKFRFACVLARHDPKDFKPEVIDTLHGFTEDADVSDIANDYLEKLEAE